MNTMFRQATLTDAPRIAEVYLASRKILLPFAPLAHSDAEIRQKIADILIPSSGVTVAITNVEIIGMMALSRDGQFG